MNNRTTRPQTIRPMVEALEARRLLSSSPSDFNWSSNPSATHTLYLDFDGAGPLSFRGAEYSIVAPHPRVGYTDWRAATGVEAFDLDGASSTFSALERQVIDKASFGVTSDFAGFDVNVTTDFNKYAATPTDDRVRVFLGDYADAVDYKKFGVWIPVDQGLDNLLGVASSVGAIFTNEAENYAFAFTKTVQAYLMGSGFNLTASGYANSPDTPNYLASIVSHEVGHIVGLEHIAAGLNGSVLMRYGGVRANTNAGQLDAANGIWSNSTDDTGQYQPALAKIANAVPLLPDEPNGRALTLGGSPLQGFINRSTDTDAVVFNVNTTGTVSVSVEPVNASGSFDDQSNLWMEAVVSTLAGQEVATFRSSFATFAAAQRISGTAALTPGSYQITIKGLSNVNQSGSALTFSGRYAVRASFEDNNSGPTIGSLVADPNPFVYGQSAQLRALNVSDPENDAISSVKFYRDSNGNGVLNTGSDELVGTDTIGSDGWQVPVATQNLPLGSNRFFAVAFDAPGAGGPSATTTVNVTEAFNPDAFEPNNSFAAATNLGTLGNYSRNGLTIHQAGDEDYFRFTASTSGTFDTDIVFSHGQGDLDLYLYNGSLSQIGSSASGTNDESISASLVAGQTYYLKVIGYSGARSPFYSLFIDGPGGGGGNLPDLTITTLNLIRDPWVAGQVVDIDYVLRNVGGGTAPASASGVWISKDGILGNADDRRLFSDAVGPLAPGASSGTRRVRVTLPPRGDSFWTGDHSYTIGVYADTFLSVQEGSETNNAAISSVGISGTAGGGGSGEVDLYGSSFNLSSQSANAGATVDADVTISNSRSGNSGAFSVAFYLSRDGTITTSDTLLGSYQVSNVAGGSSAQFTKPLTLPSAGSSAYGNGDGDYFVGMIVDANGSVAEQNEGNNSNRGGGRDSYELRIRNTSSGGGGGGGADSFDPNDSFSAATIIGTVGGWNAPNLSVGGNDPADFFRFVPQYSGRLEVAARGSVRLALYDAAGNFLEDDNDGGLADPVNRPDLAEQVNGGSTYYVRVESESSRVEAYELTIDGPDAPDDPNSVTVGFQQSELSFTEGNSGTQSINFVLDFDYLPSASWSVDVRAVSGSATAGEDFNARTKTFSGNAGDVEPFVYLSSVILGDTDFEPDEVFYLELSNFVGLRPGVTRLPVRILNDDAAPPPSKPDLHGLYMGVLASAQAVFQVGGSVPIISTLTNSGSADAGAFRVDYYLSRDSDIQPGEDLLVGSSTLARLTAGGEFGLPGSVALPASSHPFWTNDGRYWLGIVIDAGDDVAESNELNNFNQQLGFDKIEVNIGGIDRTPPTIQGTEFTYEHGHGVTLRFSEPLGDTAGFDEMTIQNLTTGQDVPFGSIGSGDTGEIGLFFDDQFPRGILPDGNYRLTVAPGSLTDVAGNTQQEALTYDFFVLAGDANHDRRVNLSDFIVLRRNLGRASGATFSQADFNYDGRVNLSDFIILRRALGASLPPAAAGASLFGDNPLGGGDDDDEEVLV